MWKLCRARCDVSNRKWLYRVGPVAEGLMMNDGYYNAGGIPYIPLPGGCGFDSAMSFGIIRSGRMAATVLGALQVSVEGI